MVHQIPLTMVTASMAITTAIATVIVVMVMAHTAMVMEMMIQSHKIEILTAK
jgi:hypothetical protein